jgi:hypothetical protein
MKQLCQSCERAAREVTEACDSAVTPYHVCKSCHTRLLSRSLRPREWYNLSKHFGWWQFLLHDDFYDEDGTASQPEEEVESPEAFPAPSMAEVAQDAQQLLEYTVTRWHMSDELVVSWCRLPQHEVLGVLTERLSTAANQGVRSVTLEVASIALKAVAADLVELAWRLYPNQVELHALIRASAACLPFAVSFGRATSAIEALPQKEIRRAMLALGYFQSPATLDWIEQHFSEPTTEEWGNLAAASGFSWPRATSWLQLGRPLSLVAIDALLAIANPRTPNLRAMQPALLEAPSAAQLCLELRRYSEQDAVPRVQQRIDAVLGYAASLSASG